MQSLLAWGLFALCAWRMLAFVLHEPLLAYGNNYDQVRYTGCVDVYPHRPGVDPGLYSPEAPLVGFSRQHGIPAPCVWTSEYVFLAPFAGWLALEESAGADGIASVRAAGLARTLVLLAVLAALLYALLRRARGAAAIGAAAAAALVLADPAILLWANTFYAEFTSVIALLACVAVLLLAWCDAGAPAPRRGFAAGAAMAVAALALAMGKVQFFALPLALALGFGLAALALARAVRRDAVRRIAPFALAALVGAAAQLASLARTDDPAVPLWHKVGTFNFAFNGLLGSSRDPARTAERIGLPRACGALAGRTIFDYAERAEWERACPAVFGLQRGRAVLALASSEPGTLARLLVRAATGLHPWVQRELGHVAGERYGDVLGTRASFSPWLERAPALALTVLLAPLAWLLLALARPRLRREALALPWLAAWLANAVIWQQLVVTMLGDGVHDISRQAFLAQAAALSWCVACAAGALAAPWRSRGHGLNPGDARENLRV